MLLLKAPVVFLNWFFTTFHNFASESFSAFVSHWIACNKLGELPFENIGFVVSSSPSRSLPPPLPFFKLFSWRVETHCLNGVYLCVSFSPAHTTPFSLFVTMSLRAEKFCAVQKPLLRSLCCWASCKCCSRSLPRPQILPLPLNLLWPWL